jgi:hypothetical protein
MVSLGTARDWLIVRGTALGLSECGWRVLPPITITDVGFGSRGDTWSYVLLGSQERLRVERGLGEGMQRVRVVDLARNL